MSKPLIYRVYSDALDELACRECAQAALLLGLWVRRIDDDERRSLISKEASMAEFKRQLAIVVIGAALFLGAAHAVHAWTYCIEIGGGMYCWDFPDE